MKVFQTDSRQSIVRYFSHELRTPLNTVLMGLKVLKRELSNYPNALNAHEILADLMESCGDASTVLDDLVTFASLNTRHAFINSDTFPVKPFLEHIVQQFSRQAAESDVDLILHFVPSSLSPSAPSGEFDRLFLCADRAHIAQVMRVLLTHALKFVDPGGRIVVSASTRAHAHSSGRVMQISVSDNGRGLSVLSQARLFQDEFEFVPGVLEYGRGAGLSLWISRKIMNQYRGSLNMTSSGEGRGTTFTMELPVLFSSADSTTTVSHEGDVIFGQSHSPHGLGLCLHMEDRHEQLEAMITPVDRTISVSAINVADTNTLESSSGPFPMTTSSGGGTTTSSSRQGVDRRDPLTGSVANTLDGIRGSVEAISHASTAPVPPAPVVSRLLRVLVVDDAPLNRKMLVRLITPFCDRIYDAADGSIAVNMMRESMQRGEPFDLILMDYQMPVMDGPSAAKAIRELGFTGLIIGVTGNALPVDITYYLAQGANRVITKPLNLENLQTELSDLGVRLHPFG